MDIVISKSFINQIKYAFFMGALIWSVGATFFVSIIAFIGLITFYVKKKILRKILLCLVGLSAGAMMGGAMLHLVPEATEEIGIEKVSIIIIISFAVFFLIERLLHWHHCHEETGECDVHTFTYMNLLGDSIHNFLDGLVIAAAFVADIKLGIITTIVVITHEIPQEIGDFGVLVYGGFSRIKALFYNFLTAVTAIVGAVIGFFLSSRTDIFTPVLIAVAAGSFIYISASDLIPELHKEPKLIRSMTSYGSFIIGILLMYLIKILFE
jgi:zinc and cadmium transporter